MLRGNRDVGDPSNKTKLDTLSDLSGTAGSDFAVTYHQILVFLLKYAPGKDLGTLTEELTQPALFRNMMNQLSVADDRQIDRIIQAHLSSQVALSNAIKTVVSKIKKAPQLSALFTSRISKGNSSNLYRFGFAYDRGVVGQLNSTTNVSYDFQNAQQLTANNRNVLRVVQQFQYVVLTTLSIPKRNVLALAGSGEGDWGSNGAPIYKANAKITLSALAGLDVPLSFTYTSLIPSTGKSDVKFQAALTFDFLKFYRGLRY